MKMQEGQTIRLTERGRRMVAVSAGVGIPRGQASTVESIYRTDAGWYKVRLSLFGGYEMPLELVKPIS
ncbi:hypothetical protein ACFLWV_02375 [Chloroflexota bacterium]